MQARGERGAAKASHFDGVVGLTVARMVNGALALVGRALLARILSPGALGAVVLATTMLAVWVRALSGGIGQAAQYMPGAAPSRALGVSVALACLPFVLLFGALALFAAEPLGRLLMPGNPGAAQIFTMLLYTAPAVFISFVASLYAVGARSYLAASVLALAPVAVPTFGYAAILAGGGGQQHVVLALIVGNVTAAAVALGYALKGWRPCWPSGAALRAIYGYGLRASAVSTFAYFVNHAVVLLAGLHADARSIGLYAVAAVFGELLTQVYGPVSMVLMSRTAAGGEHDRRSTLARVARVSFSLLAPLGLVLAAASLPVTVLVFGASYRDAAFMVLLLMPGVVLSGQQRLVENYLYGINRQWWVLAGYAVHLGACLVAMPMLVHNFGGLGLPLSYTLASACSLAALLLLARAELRGAGGMWRASATELGQVGARLLALARGGKGAR